MALKPTRSLQMSFFEPSMDELVRSNHPYRKLLAIIDFSKFCKPLRSLYKDFGRTGYPVESGFASLVLQWLEDLSDRELERFLQEKDRDSKTCEAF